MGTDSNNYFVGSSALLDEYFKIQKANDEFYNYIGDNSIYTVHRAIHPEDVTKFKVAVEELRLMGYSFVSLRMLRHDGEYRWMVVHLSYYDLEVNNRKMISFNMEDLMTIKDEIHDLKNCCDTYEQYFSLMEHFMLSYDISSDKLRIFIMGNQQKINMYNGTLSDWKDKKIVNQDLDSKYSMTFDNLCDSLTGGDKVFEYELKMRFFPQDNRMDYCLIKGKTIGTADEKCVIATVSKINPVTKKNNINLTIESSKDVGTDLINKRMITRYATDLINSKPDYPVTFVVIDLDNFKYVNDTYGHMFGDDVLCKVAEILNEAVAEKGVVGRIGGDEMFVILENIKSENELRGILRTIRSNVEWAYKGKLNSLELSCSIGCATYPEDAEDYEDLFNLADKCLYLAKEKGKNRYIIYEKELHSNYFDVMGDARLLARDSYKNNKISIMNDLLENLLYKKEITIEEACERIGPFFDLDDISIFTGDQMEHRSLWGKLDHLNLNGQYLTRDNYTDNFNDNHIFIIDNINFLDGKENLAYECLAKDKISCSIQYLSGSKKNPKGFITFNRCKLSKKWSDLEISYISMLGKIFEMVIFS